MAAAREKRPDAEPRDELAHCAVLLASLTPRERGALMSDAFKEKPPRAQLAAFYKAVCGQVFIARQAHAVEHHDAWVAEQFERQRPRPRTATQAEKDAFYARLMKDTAERAATRASALSAQAARDAAALKASKLWAISEKLCRKP
jgi:hypothetical protein